MDGCVLSVCVCVWMHAWMCVKCVDGWMDGWICVCVCGCGVGHAGFGFRERDGANPQFDFADLERTI